jgi:hypothetical protein
MQHYRLLEVPAPRGPWKVTTVAYYYALEEWDGQEILAYHWHPNERSAVTFPHLHLSAAARIGREELMTAHLPTSRITLEDALRLAIVSFGVTPRRTEWSDLLDRTQAANDA